MTFNTKLRIERTVSSIHKQLDNTFPIDVDRLILRIPNCAAMSYQYAAKIAHTSVYEIEKLCQSQSACTHYDKKNNKFLILFNENQIKERVLWSKAHEIGHIALGHFNAITPDSDAQEREADYFASCLLAPFWACRDFNVRYAGDIQKNFGISRTASEYRLVEYNKWSNISDRISTNFA